MELHMQESVIYKTLIWDDTVSLALLDTTHAVREAALRHRLTPVAAAALGRTLTATAYLCSWLKSEESGIAVTFDGGGAGGKIFAAGDGALRIRGFCEHPEADLPPRADGKLDVGNFTGKSGTLTVVRDDGEGIPIVGTSELISGEIAEDFSAYFLTSEQRPTAIALGVKYGDGVISAGGLFLQPLPGAGEDTLSRIEETMRGYTSFSDLLMKEGAEGILGRFTEEAPSVRPVRFACRCSRERVMDLLRSLGREEAEAILREEGEIRVHCHECNTDYLFGAEDLGALFGDKT